MTTTDISNMEPGDAYWAGYLAGLKVGRKEATTKYDPVDVTTMPPSPAMRRMIERHQLGLTEARA